MRCTCAAPKHPAQHRALHTGRMTFSAWTGIVEGLNYRVKLTIRKAYGFRTLEAAQIALYHALACLPEPELTHEFC
jgi:hypothetical protein